MNGERFMFSGHSLFTTVLILISSVILLAVARYFFQGAVRTLRRKWNDLFSPQKAVPALVKETRSANFIKYHTYDHGIRSTGTRYFAAFALEDGGQTELELSRGEYEQLKENDRGILRFKGSRFLGFEHS